MGLVENYWPRKSETEANLFSEYIGQSNVPGAAKARAGGNLVPVKANAYMVAMQHIKHAEHADKMSEKWETVMRLFSNPTIQSMIENKYGEKVVQAITYGPEHNDLKDGKEWKNK